MRPRDWFSVGLRLFGVWVFYRGFGELMMYLAVTVGLHWESEFSQAVIDARSRGQLHLWYTFGDLGLAIVFLFRAEQLTRWVFSEPKPDGNDEPANEQAY